MPTDWQTWTPKQRTVLCFIVHEGRVLLIHKKRGLGAGKINGPGGKLEPGETPYEAAIRETQEEIGVTPLRLEERATLHFQFTDGFGLVCTVFVADGFTGEPCETAEAIPFWAPAANIPHEQMWEDDQHWLPQVLAGQTLSAWFDFDGDRMLEKAIRPEKRVLVAGCGYLGLAVARRLAVHGWQVTGCTHSPESAAALAGEPLRATACDLADRSQVEKLRGAFAAVIHCAASGRGGPEQYRRVYVDGARHLAAVFRAPLLFTSSTSVYAQTDGAWVTEESAAEPTRETGRLLREAEEIALATGGAVARLSGLYGPRRSVLLRKFLHGEAVIEGDGGRWINQIHRDDAAAAIVHLIEARARGVFNVSDGAPYSQRGLYTGLAARLHLPLPPSGPIETDRKRGWTHKRVSPAKLRALGWEPEYATFFDALEREPDLAAPAG